MIWSLYIGSPVRRKKPFMSPRRAYKSRIANVSMRNGTLKEYDPQVEYSHAGFFAHTFSIHDFGTGSLK